MLLGDIIERLGDESQALEALLGLGDLTLLARVEAAAHAAGSTPGAVASAAVDAFTGSASDEDWVSLIGAMGRTDDPGRACLKTMVEFALAPRRDGHGCGHAHP
jgi:hypothetical protein